MNDEEFRLLDEIEEDHWWFVGKRLLLRALMPAVPAGRRLLDVGCGTGGVLRDWMDQADCVGVDRSELALQICGQRGFRRLARSDLRALPFAPDTFEAVVMLDLLEHLDDDVAVLRSVSGICVPGASFVISVPAFQLLWSRHDETFEHRRRYRAHQLEAIIREAGLIPERTTHTHFFVFPIAAVWRVLSYRLGLDRFAGNHDFWPLPAWINRLVTWVYFAEAWLVERVDLPFGVSVVCVARKPGMRPK